MATKIKTLKINFPDNEPLANHPFSAYLETLSYTALRAGYFPTLVKEFFLAVHGLELAVDCVIDSDCLKTMRYAYESACHVRPVQRTPAALSDYFTVVKNGGFWLKYLNKQVHPTDKLLSIIESAGCVYDVNPENIYFEIVNGVLMYKYQCILGSRKLAVIKE